MSHPDRSDSPDLRPIELGEAFENPVTRERAVILELPWQNGERRAVAEMTALVGARVVGEHRHPSLRETFTVLEGELTVIPAQEFSDVIVFRRPPPAIQHLMFGALSPIARRLGYRATYPSLSRTTLAARAESAPEAR